MAKTRKLRFLKSRGYGGMIIRAGAAIDVTEPWASRFIADGTAVEVESKAKAEKPTEDPKPKGKKKK